MGFERFEVKQSIKTSVNCDKFTVFYYHQSVTELYALFKEKITVKLELCDKSVNGLNLIRYSATLLFFPKILIKILKYI